mgnify:CR=1 FL=1
MLVLKEPNMFFRVSGTYVNLIFQKMILLSNYEK